MKIIFFGKGDRGKVCLEALISKSHKILCVVVQKEDEVAALALQNSIPFECPHDPNTKEFCAKLTKFGADIFVLGGYGPIVRQELISLVPLAINLHGGKLPDYRGSSPMNWALINGEERFGISVIKLDSGVDSGPILAEQTFKIEPTDTIKNIHEKANLAFPLLLIEVLQNYENGTLKEKLQDESTGVYYPLRLPDDGFIVWDMLSALEVHNRIRALTRPYPGAFTSINGVRVMLWKSSIPKRKFKGQPGRIYRIDGERFLVAAKDEALWIEEATLASSETPAAQSLKRYDAFASVWQMVLRSSER